MTVEPSSSSAVPQAPSFGARAAPQARRHEAGPSGRPFFLTLTKDEVEARLEAAGYLGRGARLGELAMRGVHQGSTSSFADLQGIARKKIGWLEDCFAFRPLELLDVCPASDESVRYVFRLEDGAVIETVLLPHHGLWTACVSSQAGCAIGCTFCATGRLGLTRNLGADEIVAQVLFLQRHAGVRIADLVFMGMGEPLHNEDAVIGACRVLSETHGCQISPKRMKISTSGLVPAIRRFTQAGHRMELVFSLVSAMPEKRARLMPIQRVFPFEDFIDAVREYAASRHPRWVTLEYLAVRGLTLSAEDADAVIELTRGMKAILNVIPWNPTGGADFERPSREEVFAWVARFRDSGIPVKVRHSFGQEEKAGCGQLGASFLGS